MIRALTFILTYFIISSCFNQSEDKHEIERKEITPDSIISETIQTKLRSQISEPFKVSNIDRLNFTSGGGHYGKQNELCDSLENDLFGIYYLIDENSSYNSGSPVGGTITVHINGKMTSWRSDDTTQTIWKIHLISDVISVWDSIKVGLTKNKIVKFGQVNNGLCIEKEGFDYLCDFGNFSAIYKFENDTLTELTVTRNCKNQQE
ncbi:hypothetical protein [Owenweeksia hongkongensis]|uniref:hypothetical protein n=1 Tax=Owenweeksia hongkongensis TaxID=253245 RepID=UPI003A8C91E5